MDSNTRFCGGVSITDTDVEVVDDVVTEVDDVLVEVVDVEVIDVVLDVEVARGNGCGEVEIDEAACKTANRTTRH